MAWNMPDIRDVRGKQDPARALDRSFTWPRTGPAHLVEIEHGGGPIMSEFFTLSCWLAEATSPSC